MSASLETRTQPRCTVPFFYTVILWVGGPLRKPPVLCRDLDTAGGRVCQRIVGALGMKARSTLKFRDVCDVEVVDEDGFLASGMMIKAQNTIMKDECESIMWPANFCSRLCIRTLALYCTREEPNLHLEFSFRDVTDGMRSFLETSYCWSRRIFQDVNTVAIKNADTIQPLIGFGFHSSANEVR